MRNIISLFLVNCLRHQSHLFIRTDFMNFFSCLHWESFDLNTLSQTLHLKQIFAWTDLLCLSRDVLYLYPLSHPSAHLNLPVDKVIFLEQTFICLIRLLLLHKVLLHLLQKYVFVLDVYG